MNKPAVFDARLTTPKAVLFDLDGTLYDFYHYAERAAVAAYLVGLSEVGISSAVISKFVSAFWNSYCRHFSSGQGILEPYQVLEQLFREALTQCGTINGLSPEVMVRRWRVEFFTSIQPFDGVKELLDELSQCAIKVGIISNGFRRLQLEKLEALGLSAYFRGDSVICAEECGWQKPSPIIFAEALRRFDVGPEGVVFVGDSLHNDVEGSLRAGLQVVWLNRFDQRLNVATAGKVLVARSFAELRGMILDCR